MATSRVSVVLVASLSLLALSVLEGRADAQDSGGYEQKATTAFALGHFADAAQSFEKAFELKSDPALLYNAAQAHRLAGNKERALTLYENYLRVYGKKEKRAEVEAHIEELKQAIAHDKAVANSPPTGTEPVAVGTAAGTTGTPAPESHAAASSAPNAVPAAPPPTTTAPVLVASGAPAPAEGDSLTKKPWFWVAVGAGVVAAALVAVLVATSGSKDPSPSIGMVNGN